MSSYCTTLYKRKYLYGRCRMSRKRAGSKTRTVRRIYPKYDSNKPSSPSTKLVGLVHPDTTHTETPSKCCLPLFCRIPAIHQIYSLLVFFATIQISIETECCDDDTLESRPAGVKAR